MKSIHDSSPRLAATLGQGVRAMLHRVIHRGPENAVDRKIPPLAQKSCGEGLR